MSVSESDPRIQTKKGKLSVPVSAVSVCIRFVFIPTGAYRFPRYLEDQDNYCYSSESDGHKGDTEEGSGVSSASMQASPQSLSCQMMS
jgi:hypothetical protein